MNRNILIYFGVADFLLFTHHFYYGVNTGWKLCQLVESLQRQRFFVGKTELSDHVPISCSDTPVWSTSKALASKLFFNPIQSNQQLANLIFIFLLNCNRPIYRRTIVMIKMTMMIWWCWIWCEDHGSIVLGGLNSFVKYRFSLCASMCEPVLLCCG